MTFNDRTTPLSLLATRRSGKARDMIAPGPDAAQLRDILAVAARTPDHGKLAPWRFVEVPQDSREAFHAMLESAYRETRPAPARAELEAIRDFAHGAPTLVVVLSCPVRTSHIPLWEQELSAGAAVMNLLHAAHAMGFVANWLTGWAAYSDAVRDALGVEGDRIAGFVFIGSPTRALEERPRPTLDDVVSRWTG